MDKFSEYEINQGDNEDDFGMGGGDRGDEEYEDNTEGVEDDEGQTFGGASFKDLERTNITDDCGGGTMPVGNLSDMYKEINKTTTDPKERFKRQVGAIAHSISENSDFDISVEMRNEMCRMATELSNTKYLNPTAYILGYIATDRGRAIDKKIINRVFDYLPELQDTSVKKPDVIRYARFIIKISDEIRE